MINVIKLLIYIGVIEIASFTFQLVNDLTVFPQQFTLNCVKIGTEHFNYSLYFKHGLLELTNAVNCSNMMTNCATGRRTLQDMNSNAYLHSVRLTWDTVAVSNSSSSFNKSSNGDLEYQCELISDVISRYHNITIKGILYSNCSLL